MRSGLGLLGAAGGVMLIASTFATVVQIKVLAGARVPGEDTSLSGSDLHGPALAILGAFALLVVAGALRGARAAMLALVLCGVAAVAVAGLRDASHLDDTGTVGQQYADARAGAATGFYLETLAGVLLIASGGGLLLAGPASAPRLPAIVREGLVGLRHAVMSSLRLNAPPCWLWASSSSLARRWAIVFSRRWRANSTSQRTASVRARRAGTSTGTW